jgi:uncharacterized protein (DUF2062 family)
VNDSRIVQFWRRRVKDPIVAQLTQGVTPERLALSCALGSTLGIFPILGTTTVLCFLVGVALKLNQPAIQAVNYGIYPLQLILFPLFLQAGSTLFHAEPITLSPIQLTREFAAGVLPFLSKYGMAGVHGIVVWTLVAPLLIAGVYFPCRTAFQKIVQVKEKFQ